jgi:hypothetical protein
VACSWLRCFASYMLSNTRLTLLAILTLYAQRFGEGSFYYSFGIHKLRLIKNLTPLWVSPVRKRVCALESKIAMLSSTVKAHL